MWATNAKCNETGQQEGQTPVDGPSTEVAVNHHFTIQIGKSAHTVRSGGKKALPRAPCISQTLKDFGVWCLSLLIMLGEGSTDSMSLLDELDASCCGPCHSLSSARIKRPHPASDKQSGVLWKSVCRRRVWCTPLDSAVRRLFQKKRSQVLQLVEWYFYIALLDELYACCRPCHSSSSARRIKRPHPASDKQSEMLWKSVCRRRRVRCMAFG